MKKSFLLALPGIMLAMCSEDPHWSAGQEVTRTIELAEFHTLEVNDIFDILLVQDSVNRAVVTCGQNNIDAIRMTIDQGVLALSQRTVMNWTSSYRHTLVELHFNGLSSVVMNSSAKIESSDTIRSPEFSVTDNTLLGELDLLVSCNLFRMTVPNENWGIYRVRGKALKSVFSLTGSAHFQTKELVTDSCDFFHSGLGDCFINARRIIKGTITRSGRVYYKNYPMLSVQIENKEGRIYIIGG